MTNNVYANAAINNADHNSTIYCPAHGIVLI